MLTIKKHVQKMSITHIFKKMSILEMRILGRMIGNTQNIGEEKRALTASFKTR